MQYAGLALYVALETVIFLPLIVVATYYSDPMVLPTVGLIAGLLLLRISIVVFTTRADFSFLRGFLITGGSWL